MVLNKKSLLICLLGACLAFAMGCSKSQESFQPFITKSNDFIIAGSGSNIPLTAKLVNYYNKNYGAEIILPNRFH